ncbi:hypothetical protein [Microbispora sp. NPDC049125]|uniref:hypothetical protein n=1 Tax=Microbispora sp. NPDC049125 TaxID=3154929 RepID=UPI0034661F6C
MARNVVSAPTKRGGWLPLLVFVAVVGAIVYGINDPVGAAHAVKTAFHALVTFAETLAADS